MLNITTIHIAAFIACIVKAHLFISSQIHKESHKATSERCYSSVSKLLCKRGRKSEMLHVKNSSCCIRREAFCIPRRIKQQAQAGKGSKIRQMDSATEGANGAGEERVIQRR